MLKNYFKITLRNINRNKFYFVVNVFGLGIALACSIIAYLNYQYDADFDTMHENADEVFRVVCTRASDGRPYGISPLPLAKAVNENIGGVEAVNWLSSRTTVKFEDNVYNERIHFTNAKLLEFFNCPFKR